MAVGHFNRHGLIPAVAYYRMSSDKQVASIPEQREAVARYAREHGYRIVREYCDEGISGDDTKHRLQFQTMHKAACHGRDFDAILVWDSDRFGRFDSLESGYWVHPLRQAARRSAARLAAPRLAASQGARQRKIEPDRQPEAAEKD